MKPFDTPSRSAMPRLIAVWTAATILSAQAAGPTTPPTPPALSTPPTPASATTPPPVITNKTPALTGAKSDSNVEDTHVYTFQIYKPAIEYGDSLYARLLRDGKAYSPIVSGQVMETGDSQDFNSLLNLNDSWFQVFLFADKLKPGMYTIRLRSPLPSDFDPAKPNEFNGKSSKINTYRLGATPRFVQHDYQFLVQKALTVFERVGLTCSGGLGSAYTPVNHQSIFPCPIGSKLSLRGQLKAKNEAYPKKITGRVITIHYGPIKIAEVTTDTVTNDNSNNFEYSGFTTYPIGPNTSPMLKLSFAGDGYYTSASMEVAINYSNAAPPVKPSQPTTPIVK